ncbi:MAG TPA: molybdenum cofactor guanylyltransferase MobA [Dokdonella sp.]
MNAFAHDAPDAPLTAAILAGGAATRLGGRDKGLEPLDGRPLVAWVLDAVAAQADAVIVVANRHAETYARYARTVGDLVAGFRGPLAGVAAALAACATPWLLTVPVDCPDPPRDLAARLRAHADALGAHAVVAHDGERRQPLFALYRRGLAASAAAAVEAELGVRHWQDALGAVELDFSDRRRQFENLNTAEEFAAHVERRRGAA